MMEMHHGFQPLYAVKRKVRNSSEELGIHVGTVGTHPLLTSFPIMKPVLITYDETHTKLLPLYSSEKVTNTHFSRYTKVPSANPKKHNTK